MFMRAIPNKDTNTIIMISHMSKHTYTKNREGKSHSDFLSPSPSLYFHTRLLPSFSTPFFTPSKSHIAPVFKEPRLLGHPSACPRRS
jgi:hypothetical protein